MPSHRKRHKHRHQSPPPPPPPPPQPPQPPPPPPLPPINHTTTTEILGHAAAIFYRHIPTFLVLSLILWFIRSNVEEMYDGLTHDYDPSVKDLLARTEFPSAYRIRQESQLSPVSNNFFSGDSYDHPQSNQSSGNTTNSSFDHVNSFPQIIIPGGFSFRAEVPKNNDTVNKSAERSLDDPLIEFDLELLRKGLMNGREDVNMFTLLNASSVVYAFAFFTSLFAYAWAHGIVFLQVIDHLSGNQRSVYHSIHNGVTFGCRRLMQFSFFTFLVVAMRVMFIPFINLAPWVQGPQWETADFTVKWFCADLIVGFIFSVATWVAVVDWRISIIEISQETWHMLAAFHTPAIEIRVLETIICGSLGRGIVWTFLGNSCSLAFQCVMEVFFLVAWVLYYLSARDLLGRGQMQALLAELYVN